MSVEKVLTKEILERFMADKRYVDLEAFTAIEDAAAEDLSKCQKFFEFGRIQL